jgi:hypothetical protein
MKPKPTLVPPLVEGPSFVQNTAILMHLQSFEPTDRDMTHLVTPIQAPVKQNSQFIKKLEAMVKHIPFSVAKGSEDDILAPFGGNPRNQDIVSISADELWEANLNQFLKSVLGWGGMDTMDGIVCHGRNGMDSVLEFARFCIEKRGVNEGLFEGKLSQLMNAVERM